MPPFARQYAVYCKLTVNKALGFNFPARSHISGINNQEVKIKHHISNKTFDFNYSANAVSGNYSNYFNY